MFKLNHDRSYRDTDLCEYYYSYLNCVLLMQYNEGIICSIHIVKIIRHTSKGRG